MDKCCGTSNLASATLPWGSTWEREELIMTKIGLDCRCRSGPSNIGVFCFLLESREQDRSFRVAFSVLSAKNCCMFNACTLSE